MTKIGCSLPSNIIYFKLPTEKGNIQKNRCCWIWDNGSGHVFTLYTAHKATLYYIKLEMIKYKELNSNMILAISHPICARCVRSVCQNFFVQSKRVVVLPQSHVLGTLLLGTGQCSVLNFQNKISAPNLKGVRNFTV